MGQIEVGSVIPHFQLRDQYGKIFSIDPFLGINNIVIFFYPQDRSPGCTKEVCSFREQKSEFEELDAVIMGISGQSVESHLAFSNLHHLNYPLLSDPENRVRKLFGVRNQLWGLLPGRVTYVINKEGRVAFIYRSQLQVNRHVNETLKMLRVSR